MKICIFSVLAFNIYCIGIQNTVHQDPHSVAALKKISLIIKTIAIFVVIIHELFVCLEQTSIPLPIVLDTYQEIGTSGKSVIVRHTSAAILQ